MKAGKLDRLIDIQAKTDTQSMSGEPIEAWANVVSRRPCEMRPVKGDERWSTPQDVAEDQIEFRVRYSSDIVSLSPLHRVIYPALSDGDAVTGRIYNIIAVHEIGRREGLSILTSFRADVR